MNLNTLIAVISLSVLLILIFINAFQNAINNKKDRPIDWNPKKGEKNDRTCR